MNLGCRRWLVVVALVGCGPDIFPPADLDNVCGQPAPVRILDLPADAPLAYVREGARVADRRIIALGFAGEPEPSVSIPQAERQEIWSVGECGASPTLLLEGALRVFTYPVWPDVQLACVKSTGEVLTLDPHGMRPPHAVLRDPDCRGTDTPHGLIVVEPHDEDTGALVLQRWVDDPWTQSAVPEVLLDPVRVGAVPSHVWPAYRAVVTVVDDAVFAVTPENDLVRVSLTDMSVTVEARDVREFDASSDGRYLVWQDVEPTNDDERWPAGAVYLLDRQTAETRYLADAPLAATRYTSLEFAEFGVVRLRLGYLYEQPERFWWLPEMASIDVPDHLRVMAHLEDGRWLVGDHFGGPYQLFDPDLVQGRSLFAHKGDLTYAERGVEIIEGVQCCIEDDFARSEGPLWYVPWDEERTKLADRVTDSYRKLSDGRIVTALDVDEAWLGALVVVDPLDREERLVEDRVSSVGPSIGDDDVILYAVHDADRSGVWITKLAP